MTRVPILACILFAACGDRSPIPHDDLSLRIRIGPRIGMKEVALGRAFPLEVVRVWSKAGTPADWSDAALAPLAVQLLETKQREDKTHVEETRRYRAFAFTRNDVTIGEQTLRIRPALDAKTPGAAELPGPLAQPFAWLWWTLAGCVALAGVAFLARRRGPTPATPAAAAAKPSAPRPPHERALQRLARLRNDAPRTRREIQAFYAEATGLLRDYAGERFGLPAAVMTSQELAAAQPGLGRVFDHADRVRFARHMPDAAERMAMLDAAARYIDKNGEATA